MRFKASIDDSNQIGFFIKTLTAIERAIKDWGEHVHMSLKVNPDELILVEEKFPKENFRVNREMRDEILVYESILSNFWAKIASKCRENCVKI